MPQVCPRCATPAADHDSVCRVCGIPLAGHQPWAAAPTSPQPTAVTQVKRPGVMVPVICGIVGVVCMLVVLAVFVATVGSANARRASATSQPTSAGGQLTAVPGSAAYPAVTLTGRACGSNGREAYGNVAAGNDATPCDFAVNVQMNFIATTVNGTPPTSVTAYEAKSGRGITLTCSGTQPVTCTGGNSMVVYLYGGQATFK